jgi:lysophospholipase L1-like esterase
MTNTKTIRWVVASAVLVLVSACGADDDPSAAPAPSATASEAASPTASPTASPSDSSDATAPPSRSLVVFGDSWPFGAHCDGCTPFPDLYAEALNAEASTEFTNLTEDGGTTDSLLGEMQSFEPYRTAIADADVIVMSLGANDLEDAFGIYAAGDCGPPKGLGCFREVADAWGRNMDAMLTVIHDLRGKRPTAIRVLTQANEADAGLSAAFGEKFVTEQLPQVMAWQKEEFCRAAARHHDQCVDLRPVLNGPELNEPTDVNTQEAMQTVADTLLALGLPELQGA